MLPMPMEVTVVIFEVIGSKSVIRIVEPVVSRVVLMLLLMLLVCYEKLGRVGGGQGLLYLGGENAIQNNRLEFTPESQLNRAIEFIGTS